MFFNKLFLCLLALFHVSCANDTINKAKGVVVSLAYDTGCFKGIGQRLESWSNGEGDSEIIAKDFNCVVDGISYFLLRVRGEKLGSYSAQEIFNFTEKFFKTAAIKKQTVDDLLIIKSWLIGGAENTISFEELNRVSWFLKSTSKPIKNLTPYAHKLFFKDSLLPFDNNEAVVFKKSLAHLSQEFKALTAYSTANVELLKFETIINRILSSQNISELNAKDLRSIWNMLSVVLGKTYGSYLSFNPKEGLSDLAFRAHYIALRFKYGVSDIGWRNINSYDHLEAVVNESLLFLKTVLDLQPQKSFATKSLNLLLLEGLNILNFDFEVTEKWVAEVVQIIMTRYFASSTLGFEQVDKLGLEWTMIRDFYSQTLVLQGLAFEGSLVAGQNFVALSDVNRRTLDFAWPMLSNNDGYVLNPLKSTKLMADYGNLFWVNWQRALATIFLQAYSEDPIRKQELTGVNVTELKTGYGEVFKILNDIDYLGDGQVGSWFRIFNEANLFVPRAKADSLLAFEEGVDYFALLFSGIAFSRDLFASMNTACPNPDKACQLNWFKASGDNTWQNYAPEFSNYLKSISNTEWENFAEGFELMARKSIGPEPFKRFELLVVSIAIQYIEIFLRKYDLNNDLQINFTETVNSFDKFSAALLALPQVKGTEAEEDPSTLLAFYTFFLRRGRLPRQVFGQYVELLGWRQRVNKCATQTPEGQFIVIDSSGCEYESGRGNLMKILAFLSNSI